LHRVFSGNFLFFDPDIYIFALGRAPPACAAPKNALQIRSRPMVAGDWSKSMKTTFDAFVESARGENISEMMYGALAVVEETTGLIDPADAIVRAVALIYAAMPNAEWRSYIPGEARYAENNWAQYAFENVPYWRAQHGLTTKRISG
jgi:hypothetical protein